MDLWIQCQAGLTKPRILIRNVTLTTGPAISMVGLSLVSKNKCHTGYIQYTQYIQPYRVRVMYVHTYMTVFLDFFFTFFSSPKPPQSPSSSDPIWFGFPDPTSHFPSPVHLFPDLRVFHFHFNSCFSSFPHWCFVCHLCVCHLCVVSLVVCHLLCVTCVLCHLCVSLTCVCSKLVFVTHWRFSSKVR